MAQLVEDLRSGIRTLVKYPTLSLGAILTFGLGLGLSTTVFCIVNGALFKGLPFEQADRVVALVGTNPLRNEMERPIAVQDLPFWQARQGVFEELGAYSRTQINLSGDQDRPERLNAGQLTVAAFEVLRVKPILGHGFQAGDDQFGAAPVILLGYNVWRDHLGGSADVLGRTIRVNGVARTIIGVMPPRFGFPELERVWVPLQFNPLATPRGSGPDYQVIARLKTGISLRRARADARTIAAQLESDFPQTNRGVSADVLPYARLVLGGEAYGVLYTMLGAGIGVLLIACVNVSNLLVARASLRRREIAVRMALGAGRSRVVRQHLTEVLVLASLGGGIGIALSIVGVRWFSEALTIDPPPFWISFGLDGRVVIFVASLIVLSSLLAGGLPAIHASRVTAGTVLKDDSRSSTSGRLGRFSGALVMVELAVSCGLLIAAGLMIKSVVLLKSVRIPFAVENILTLRVNLPQYDYPDAASRVRLYERLLPRLAAIPGVDAATLSDGLPAAGSGSTAVQIEGRAYARDIDYPTARQAVVDPGYFETFQTRPLRGRSFAIADNRTGQPVAVVNETFARTYFPGLDPIGRRIKRGRTNSSGSWLTIVGAVPDMLMQGIGDANESGAGFYVPLAQSDVGGSVQIALRTRKSPGAATSLVRSALASIDRDLPIDEVLTMEEVIRRQTMYYTLFAVFFVAFGGSALFLASAGLYGVMSFAVTQRTREMGVRSALGAGGRQLVLLAMRRSLIQLTAGLLLGLGLGLTASGPLEPVLYRVNPRDPSVVALVVTVLAATSVLASFLPAWRITKIDPAVALSVE